MRLIRLHIFRERYFDEDSRPGARTVKRWPCAMKQGSLWYVDLDKLEDSAAQQVELAELLEDDQIAEALQ